ncbi:hypothetical protein EMIT0324P_11066 [Pseudomonas chlororaphis]|uniref:hypothetical protein n=1 Tax=Pseudomonas chlororaphis TaxID=587753 RepID=UPI0039E389A2
MTYVRNQTSEELAVHMRSLQRMPGWHEPLADRLWEEVEKLRAENEALRKAMHELASHPKLTESQADILRAAMSKGEQP